MVGTRDAKEEKLRCFRRGLHASFRRRADALFELSDAILTAETVPSLVHLSLQAVHRRGWGSLYAALSEGCADDECLRDLFSQHPLVEDGGEYGPHVYAVDVSAWPRCDAEASPERSYHYHPSRHSAGRPIVAGWAYQLVAQMSFDRDSWVAPVDARRVRPTEDANEVATEQVRTLIERLARRGDAACSSSTPVTTRCACSSGSKAAEHRSW